MDALARITDPAARRRAWGKIAVIYGITLLLSSVFNVMVIASGKLRGAEQIDVTGIMWGPALAAFITARLYGDDWRAFGWDLSPARWLWRGYWIPIAYAVPVDLFVWLTGLAGFDLAGFAAKKAPEFGWSADSPWL